MIQILQEDYKFSIKDVADASASVTETNVAITNVSVIEAPVTRNTAAVPVNNVIASTTNSSTVTTDATSISDTPDDTSAVSDVIIEYMDSDDSIVEEEPNKIDKHKQSLTVAHDGRIRYRCKQCDRSYYRPSKLKLHIKTIHKGIRDHACDKRYATTYDLQAHAGKHLNCFTTSKYN